MNAKQAMAKLCKLLGKNARYRIVNDAPDKAEREELRGQIKVLFEQRQALDVELKARRAQLLADPMYRGLAARYSAASKALDLARGRANSHRIRVGTVGGVAGMNFFHVKAEGDTWEQVIHLLEADRDASKAPQ